MTQAPSIGLSNFARQQHLPNSGRTYFMGTDDQLIARVACSWDNRKPGKGEKTLARKVVVPVSPLHFVVPRVPLTDDLVFETRAVRRQAGEELHLETIAVGQRDVDGRILPLVPVAPRFASVVLYSAEALLENGGERSTDREWEIVCLLAGEDPEEPMSPRTMARNYLGLPGGTKSDYTAQEFAEAIMYDRGVAARI